MGWTLDQTPELRLATAPSTGVVNAAWFILTGQVGRRFELNPMS